MARNPRLPLCAVWLAVAAYPGLAQDVILTAGTATAEPGTTVNVAFTLSSSGSQATGVQWKLTPGAGIAAVNFAPGPAATAAGKSISCSAANGTVDCVLFGLNSTAISNGVVAVAAVTMAPATTATHAALTLSSVIAATAQGTALSATSVSGGITIVQPALPATPPVKNTVVTQRYTGKTKNLTAPSFGVSNGNELLVALISADDAGQPQGVSKVSGGSLSWRRAVQTNQQGGTAEIWYAFAPRAIRSVSVKATLDRNAAGQITVVTFHNVDASNGGAAAIGAVGSRHAAAGAPSVTVVPTRVGSLIVGTGSDPRLGSARVPAAGQSLVSQLVVAGQGTFWVQSIDGPVAAAGTPLVLAATAPTQSAYNLSAVEIRGMAAPAGASSLSSVRAADANTEKGPAGVVPAEPVAELVVAHPGTLAPGYACSPGGLVTLLGEGFTTQPAQPAAPPPAALRVAGVEVFMNGQPAPLLMASPGQLQVLCPELPVGAAVDIEVRTEDGRRLRAERVLMRSAAPALFAVPGSDQGLIVLSGTGQLVGPASADGSQRPARPGEWIRLYAAGLGPVQDPWGEEAAPGQVAPLDRAVITRFGVAAVVGGREVRPAFAGLAPGMTGLYQVDVLLPRTAPTGPSVPVMLKLRLEDGAEVLSNLVITAIEAPRAHR